MGTKTITVSPCFSQLSPTEIDYYNQRAQWKTFRAGQIIFNSRDKSTDVYFIASGQARIITDTYNGREIIITELSNGDFFGEIAAIDGKERSASLHALSNCTVFMLSKSDFQHLCEHCPSIAWKVMQHLASIVRRMNERLMEVTFLKAKQRLYRELIRLSKKRQNHHDQYIISPTPVQSEIANRISSHREIVSRDMKDLERQGILKRERGGLVILDKSALKIMAKKNGHLI